MGHPKKSIWKLSTTVVADASTPQNPNCGSGVQFVAERVVDQGFPQCFPMPGMTLRIDAATRIGPAAGRTVSRGPAPAARRRAAPVRKGTSKRKR